MRTGNTNASGDGQTGVNIFPNGSISLQVSKEDQADCYPHLSFYHQGAENPTSSIGETSLGVLSIPNKLAVGLTATDNQEHVLTVVGTIAVSGASYHDRSIFVGVGKTSIEDGISGAILANGGNLYLTATKGNNPSVYFYRSQSTDLTARIANSSPGIVSVLNQLHIGSSIRESATDYTLYVDGNTYCAGNIRASSVNNVLLTSSGDGTQFLGDDGAYHDLQLNNYLSLAGGIMQGSIWMNYNKIHLGDSPTGSSGISFVSGRGVVIESSTATTEKNNSIELYAKLDGNIILNPTTGKALYKNTEIATVETTTLLDNRVTALEAEILGANAALNVLETNSI
ncbi:MAG: hypothetical protein LUD15_05390 [Bacteroides sp.]|nr:hypothetical protein [Bacteroides sp.]